MEARDLGDGGLCESWRCGCEPTLIVIYRDDYGGYRVATAKNGMTLRLPWNPLAKWS